MDPATTTGRGTGHGVRPPRPATWGWAYRTSLRVCPPRTRASRASSAAATAPPHCAVGVGRTNCQKAFKRRGHAEQWAGLSPGLRGPAHQPPRGAPGAAQRSPMLTLVCLGWFTPPSSCGAGRGGAGRGVVASRLPANGRAVRPAVESALPVNANQEPALRELLRLYHLLGSAKLECQRPEECQRLEC